MVGTLLVTGIAMLVAVPLGLGVAVYLAEYARPRIRRIVKPVVELLAGIPSVVLGYFAIAMINPEFVSSLFSSADKAFTLMAAGIGVGILTIPIIATVAEDALRAVRWRSARRRTGSGRSGTVDVPCRRSRPRSRASSPPSSSASPGDRRDDGRRDRGRGRRRRSFQLDPLEPGQTMTAAMAALGFGSDQVAGDDLAFQSLYFIGLLLFFMTFLLNFFSDFLVRRVREVY